MRISLFSQIQEMLFILGKHKRKLPLMIILFICVTILDLLGIGIIGPYIAILIDPAIIEDGKFNQILDLAGISINSDKLLLELSVLVISIFILKFLGALIINWSILRFCYRQSYILRSRLMKIYQSLPYMEYVNRDSSEYIFNINNIVPQFTLAILQSYLRLASEGIVIIAIFAVLAWYEPLTLIVFGFLLLTLIYSYDKFSRSRIADYGRVVNSSSTMMVQAINEGIGGLKEIRILGKESFFLNRLKNNAKEYSEVSRKSSFLTTIPKYFLELFIVLLISILVILIHLLNLSSENLLLTLSVFGMASIRLLPSSNQIISSFTQIRFGKDSVNRLATDIKNFSEYSDLDAKSNIKLLETFQSIEFKELTFNFPGQKTKIFNNVNFIIKPMDSIALIGESGAGKSTFLDILLGLIKPSSGSVLYNNKPLNENSNSFRKRVGYLPQQAFLLNDTVRNNIILSDIHNDSDDQRVLNALRRARLEELVKKMPNGLDTVIGEKGVTLSGGQKQRIAIARIFYHQREIIIMDESTSALDKKTETEIINEINLLKGQITLIVIAHSRSVVRNCDHIFKIEDGQLLKQKHS